ncbi:rhodanese-like domain-containing protein [Sedimentitalea sp. XS_ASV28]|uniref:rhodanese-like domain-containing protein n=1 Tax=Sedimentitalea sp. XS_ASV28 TaxID=3241296 RepID=UPI00351166F0
MQDMLPFAALDEDPAPYYLIDVRDAEDYAAAHVLDAVHIPLTELGDRAAEFPAAKVPVTICSKGGGRSAEGAALLRTRSQPGALWLEGGTNGWLKRNSQISNRNGGNTG